MLRRVTTGRTVGRWSMVIAPSALASALLLVSVASLLTSCHDGPRRLSARSERYPYFITRAVSDVTPCPRTVYSVDYDGDGIDEEVKFADAQAGASYMMVAHVSEGRHYALLSKNFLTMAGLCGLADVTGDGLPEIIYWEQPAKDRMQIVADHFEIHGATGRDTTVASIEWEPHEGLMRDGSWGAFLTLLAAFDTGGDGAADVLAIGLCAGVTKRPRGVWFWDLSQGRFIAKFNVAGAPSGGHRVGDIDGDGMDELVVGIGSPGNGVTEGEWDDSHSYVMAFDADGAMLWCREQDGYSSDVHVVLDDLDGDGSLEVVTGVGGHSEEELDRYGVHVIRGADGALLASDTFRSSVNDLCTMACADGRRLFTGSTDGLLRRYRWDGSTLALEDVIDIGDSVDGVASMPMGAVPAPSRLVVGTARGIVAVLNDRLVPLALMDLGDGVQEKRNGPLAPTVASVDGRAESVVMVMGKASLHRLRLVKRPLPYWMTIALPIVGIIAALFLVPVTRRSGVAALRRWVAPRASRGEALDALLGSLAAASHGRLAATSTLRRLREQFRMLQNYDGDPPRAFSERFEQAASDVLQVGVPNITDIGRQAEKLGLVPSRTASLRRGLKGLVRILDELPSGLPSRRGAEVLGDRLDGIMPDVESSLLAVRSAAAVERSCDPGVELERALSSRSTELQEAGVRVDVEGRGQLSGLRACGTPAEISFVLENLIGNALEALKGCETRELHIALQLRGDSLQVRVADTGAGVRDEERARIFESGWSGRQSGTGQGLSVSRETLALRGGSLVLLESLPGEGAVFMLTLHVCGGGE